MKAVSDVTDKAFVGAWACGQDDATTAVDQLFGLFTCQVACIRSGLCVG